MSFLSYSGIQWAKGTPNETILRTDIPVSPAPDLLTWVELIAFQSQISISVRQEVETHVHQDIEMDSFTVSTHFNKTECSLLMTEFAAKNTIFH